VKPPSGRKAGLGPAKPQQWKTPRAKRFQSNSTQPIIKPVATAWHELLPALVQG